ncbi:hypothetical protein BaRGS_00006057 [Batillaria attramentaria]|uniref:Uncharacterized protein n=1 Tax=Batillaria attramentaria TaxID=370345 RepID=A0ABD0LU38_9CAEN
MGMDQKFIDCFVKSSVAGLGSFRLHYRQTTNPCLQRRYINRGLSSFDPRSVETPLGVASVTGRAADGDNRERILVVGTGKQTERSTTSIQHVKASSTCGEMSHTITDST